MPAAATSRPVRIALLNYEPIRVAGIREIFSHLDEWDVASVQLPELLKGPHFDALLLALRDIDLTCELIANLRTRMPWMRIIVMGASSGEEDIVALISAGARGWIEETVSPDLVVQAIQVVLRGSIWAPRRILSLFVDRVVRSPQPATSQRAHLTSRERDVLGQLVLARSNREIAAALSIREQTVKSYIARMMRKVGVDNRIALSMHAGQLDSGPSDES